MRGLPVLGWDAHVAVGIAIVGVVKMMGLMGLRDELASCGDDGNRCVPVEFVGGVERGGSCNRLDSSI